MSIVLFIIILLILVIAHESGHFFSAKAFGIKVEEFGFGFPPKLFGKKYGETEYTVNLLPIGGFVKIYGENPEEGTTAPDKEDLSRAFFSKPKWQQAIVLFDGVLANFLLAWLLLSFGFMAGLPISISSDIPKAEISNTNLVVVSVLKGSPAQKAGLLPGDEIVGMQTADNTLGDITPESVRVFTEQSAGKSIIINYRTEKNTELKSLLVTPAFDKASSSYEIGISMDEVGTAKLPFFKALGQGMVLDWYLTKSTAIGLYTLIKEGISGHGSLASVTGPVGMVAIVGNAYQFGFVYLLSFMALISINLAIINLIPFPALDGGRLLFLLIEKIKGSRMNPKIVNTVNAIGFSLLIFFMLVVTYHDLVTLL